jgi:hypothetical protein
MIFENTEKLHYPFIIFSVCYSISSTGTDLTINIQGVIQSCTDIFTTCYWLHVELGKNI